MTICPRVLLDDEAILAVDKPAGLLVAPDRYDKNAPHLMAWVHREFGPTVFNVHRLDRDTSGAVLCAKTKAALDDLSLQFERGEVDKEYVALVRGRPPAHQGTIDRPIVVDLEHPGRMKAARRGKQAITVYEVVERFRGYSWLRLRPKTGRTHQLRVHLQYIGCPIVADPWYGDGRPLLLSEIKRGYKPPREGERPLLSRLALHAHRLTFRHPLRGDQIVVESPIPKEMDAALKQLRKWAA
ncbi:MAG: RluA family pseudouridine synthase [Kiritimatiellae bacterium]|nr:RluA family pseudouridine synthase [Kiritimatiellia bacterium]MDW8459228.1 RluA family pseudouridine synthase [Verrucomicrobiota bacterium]